MKNVPPLNNTNITLEDIQAEAERLQQKLRNQKSPQAHRITRFTPLAKPVPVVTINNEIISTEGNLTIISGASKSGKSAFTGILLAGAISTDGLIDGLEFVNVQPNLYKKAVMHIDTEQALHKHQNNLIAILDRANMYDCDYFLSYNIRELDVNEYTTVTTQLCEEALQQFNGIHLMVIDGIADYIKDVNDAEQSTAIVKYFSELAVKYQMPIILIVHTNPGTDKERGHLGSQCQRKCESLLMVKTEGNISFIEPKLLRMAGKGNIPSIQFMYDKDKGYHVGCGIRSTTSEDKNAIRLNSLKIICQQVFERQEALGYTQVINAIMQQINKSRTSAKNYFIDMQANNMIVKGEDKNWRMATQII